MTGFVPEVQVIVPRQRNAPARGLTFTTGQSEGWAVRQTQGTLYAARRLLFYLLPRIGFWIHAGFDTPCSG